MTMQALDRLVLKCLQVKQGEEMDGRVDFNGCRFISDDLSGLLSLSLMIPRARKQRESEARAAKKIIERSCSDGAVGEV